MTAAAETVWDSGPPDLVDWELAARVGRRIAGGPELPVREAWNRAFAEYSARADLAVAELTGLGGELPAPPAVVFDRAEWISANLGTLRAVLRPVAARLAERRPWTNQGPLAGIMRATTRGTAGVQAGALLGIVGQRVLGQYDLGLGRTAAEGGAVWYVAPNIVTLERRHGFRPADFRLWIALHELTHRRQFDGVPWLGGYVRGLVDAYLSTVDLDEEALLRLTGQALEAVRRHRAGEAVDLLDVLVPPAQRDLVRRIQAVMSVLEGHGELVMNALGATMVAGSERMHEILRRRRGAASPQERVVQQLLGLRQKLDQYAQGEGFLRRLQERGGMGLVNRVFEAPELLPSLAEVRDPDRWLARAG